VSGLDAGLQVVQHVVQLVVPGRLTEPPHFHFYSATWRFLYSSENGGANKGAFFQVPHKLCPLPFFCPETRDCIKDDLSYWWERGG
jgi:hypothetical protein